MLRLLTDERLRKAALASLILAAGACLILWMARICYAISFVTPYMAVTTGREEDCLFSIWKLIEHQSVYTDPHRIPFAVSYYNWGFYWFYGLATKACLQLFHLDAVWIATIGRLITVGFALAAGGILYFAERRLASGGLFARPAMRWAWCAIATCSSLVGFWALTVRPDIGALALECAGLYAMVLYLDKPSMRLIVAAVVLFYLAWAFKQSQVTMLAGSAFSLLFLKRWRAFLLLSGAWWLLVIVTICVGGPAYRECAWFSQTSLPQSLGLGLENLGLALLRNPFLPFGMAAALWIVLRRKDRAPLQPATTLIATSLLFSFCFAVATSFKLGASTNYFIPAAWLAMLLIAAQWKRMHSRSTTAALAVCSLLIVCEIAVAHVAYGAYRQEDADHRMLAQRLLTLPGPVYLTDSYANLPWVQRDSPHFVVIPTYGIYPAPGTLEDGGLEGLISEGYFGTVVTNPDDDYPSPLLERYELVGWQSGYKFYRRIGR